MLSSAIKSNRTHMEPMTIEELTNLTSSQLLMVMEEAREGAIKAGSNWAEARAEYQALKELMPTYLAETQREIFHRDHISVSQARMEALAEPQYKMKLNAMNAAQKRAHKLETEYKSFYESIKAIAAISYVKNSEIKLAR